MVSLDFIIARNFSQAYREINISDESTFENTSIVRNIAFSAREGIIKVPICVYNQFTRELQTSPVEAAFNKRYICTLRQNTSANIPILNSNSSLYKKIITTTLFTGNDSMLTTIQDTNVKWHSGTGYLEVELKKENIEVIFPVMVSTFVCQLKRYQSTIQLCPLYPVLHFNARLLNMVPEIKTFFNKLVSCISDIQPYLTSYGEDDSALNDYNKKCSLIVEDMQPLPSRNNTLTLDITHRLSTADIQGFEEWICN